MSTFVVTYTSLALVVVFLIDFIRNAFDKADAIPRAILQLLAAALGVAGAFIWDINVLSHISALQDVTGKFLTGLSVGAVAGGYHSLFQGLAARQPSNNPKGLLPKK